jgi:hypothetical protein
MISDIYKGAWDSESLALSSSGRISFKFLSLFHHSNTGSASMSHKHIKAIKRTIEYKSNICLTDESGIKDLCA